MLFKPVDIVICWCYWWMGMWLESEEVQDTGGDFGRPMAAGHWIDHGTGSGSRLKMLADSTRCHSILAEQHLRLLSGYPARTTFDDSGISFIRFTV